MTLGEFRKLTEYVSDESELVIWAYFDVLDVDGVTIVEDCGQGCTNFELNITDWDGPKKALHFTLDGEDIYKDMKATIN